MNNLYKISVVVPIYKVEHYLKSCLDSILDQTFSDFELILVDDGSPDKSGRICDEYKEKDKRIRVIHQVNAGVTAARRNGVKLAVGEYICFVDADDTLPKNSLEDLYVYAKDHDLDIVMGNYVEVDEKGKVLRKVQYKQGIYTGKDFLVELIDGASGVPWGNLFRRNLFDEEVMNIPAEIKRGEDLIMKTRLALRAGKVGGIPVVIYNYLQRENSAVHVFKISFAYEKQFDHIMFTPLREANKFKELEGVILPYRIRSLRRVLVEDFDISDEWLKEMSEQSSRLKLSTREKFILFCCTNVVARKCIRVLHRYRVKDRLLGKK